MSYKEEVVILVCGKFIMKKIAFVFFVIELGTNKTICVSFFITEYEIKSFSFCTYVVSDQFMYKLCLIRKRNISTRRWSLFVTMGMTDAVSVKNAPSELTNMLR